MKTNKYTKLVIEAALEGDWKKVMKTALAAEEEPKVPEEEEPEAAQEEVLDLEEEEDEDLALEQLLEEEVTSLEEEPEEEPEAAQEDAPVVDEEQKDEAIGKILACVESLKGRKLPKTAAAIRDALMYLV